MAISGPPPKAMGTKQRRNPDTHEWHDVTDAPYSGPSPDLPESYEWNPGCRAWFEAVRTMPHAALFRASDWVFVLETAFVVNELWSGNSAVAGEVRQRNAKLGVTIEDRMKLRIRYVEPEVGGADSAPARQRRKDPRLVAVS